VKEEFDIVIKDNFLDKNIFEKIHKKINTFIYFHNKNHQKDKSPKGYNHIWYSRDAEDEIRTIVKNKCEKVFNKKFKVKICSYTMLASVEPLVHTDYYYCDYQAIIYIKGNTNLHKGTGFYLNDKLNTHIGFNENRAVLWRSNNFHSPLNWASDDKSKRYSIICQLIEIKN
jgi:hypothetical protein|tara:strand:- start:41 stop:553 length:513 start_codon:yes stop_codon:yes gene_type:complete